MFATIDAGRIELQLDRDGKYRWYLGNSDTEVSGKTIADACDEAQKSWPEVGFDFELDAAGNVD